MDRNLFPSHLETHRNTVFICKLLCMADMVAHYYGTTCSANFDYLTKTTHDYS